MLKDYQVDSRFDKLEVKNTKLYLNSKASNGQLIGSNEIYKSIAILKNGIASVAKNALDTVVK